ncbi:MAG: F0F1 ATP synthase subunit delta [Thermomicrobiales bacterium]
MASSVAKRYAEAVFSLGKENGTLSRWEADLALLNDVASDEAAKAFLSNPTSDSSAKINFLNAVLDKHDGQKEAKNLARMLVDRQRLEIIPGLHDLFEEAMLAEQGIVFADVTTAEPLDEAGQEIVRQQLSKFVGKEVQLRLKVDPSIIGGIVALIGDQLVDGSVINQLRRLRARLSAA